MERKEDNRGEEDQRVGERKEEGLNSGEEIKRKGLKENGED